MPLGLLCSMASRPPSRSRRCRLQLKVSKEEYLVCQPTSHQHGLVGVTSPLRFPSDYEGQDGNIITVGAKRCRCAEVFFQSSFQTAEFTSLSSQTEKSLLLAPNASVMQKCCPSSQVCLLVSWQGRLSLCIREYGIMKFHW